MTSLITGRTGFGKSTVSLVGQACFESWDEAGFDGPGRSFGERLSHGDFLRIGVGNNAGPDKVAT